MQLFYIPYIPGESVWLDETESKHCIRVLRLGIGDKIQLVDGKGGVYEARISDPNPKRCSLEVISTENNYGEKGFSLHVAIAPTKNIARFEWFLEKATEIGVDEITPVLCRFSERKSLKPERLEKIIIAAMKQSLKAYLPKLNQLIPFGQLLGQPFEGGKYIAHCYEGKKKHLKDSIKKNENSLVLIGPEGDFSKEEVNLALRHGFKGITLGNSRLRTETAGIAACHIINLANE
ncbi:16S rRNA (uracil(1498)-N(3))-methyltransferase [hydrothermal vent metagenome]|uniref:16S rRNA (uracil(1498)-N(3))-methyltransferase n=1 Tax=hydrothermal vent metagenome TaxID=652676 RepID=A0A3B0UC46_9ZZZZ